MSTIKACILALALLVGTFASAATLPTTTTLAAETAPNTSAGLPNTLSNGDLGPASISKVDIHSLLPASAANVPVLAVYQPWFRKTNHMEIGLDESDPQTVTRQVEDAQSRGLAGFMVNWYGQPVTSDKKFMDDVTKLVKSSAEAHAGFSFALQYDGGAYKNCNCDKTAKFIADMKYARTNFFSSPAYLKVNSRPVVEMFSVDEDGPVDWTAIRTAVPELLMIFRNASGWNHAQSDGMFGWVGINLDPTKALTMDTTFYKNAALHTDKLVIAPIWLGFNDTLASWGQNRITPRNCGKTYLQTVADAAANMASVNYLELNTWNDYEEGTEFESGIDSCLTITTSLTGAQLSWMVGDSSLVDHFTVFASLDGQNLSKLTDVTAETDTLDLTQFSLKPATYQLFVKATAKSQLTNAVSGATSYTVPNRAPTANLVIMPASGTAPLTITADASGSSDADGSISLFEINFGDGSTLAQTAAASHTYSSPGTYTVTATVLDDLGAIGETSMTVTVVAPPPPPPPPVLALPVVAITSPSNGYPNAGPAVSLKASASSANGTITAMKVYVDGVDTGVKYTTPISAWVGIPMGTHTITVNAWDVKGQVGKSLVKVTRTY